MGSIGLRIGLGITGYWMVVREGYFILNSGRYGGLFQKLLPDRLDDDGFPLSVTAPSVTGDDEPSLGDVT
ncbi:MAG: hypothetical protein Q7V05_03110 [Methanoregula sp.]|nr:hypothetical protein [Methanoregula sp.]